MPSDRAVESNRRKFLQYLAASPLLAGTGAAALAEPYLPRTMVPDPLMWGPRQSDHLIKSPKDAINVFDLEPVCRQNVPPAHFGYMASGIDDEVTLRANREGFLKFQPGRAVCATSARSTWASTSSAPDIRRRSCSRRSAATARFMTMPSRAWRGPPPRATTFRSSRP
jgi:hypothetical protein